MRRPVLASLLAAVVLSACGTTTPTPTALPVVENGYAIVDVTIVDVQNGVCLLAEVGKELNEFPDTRH